MNIRKLIVAIIITSSIYLMGCNNLNNNTAMSSIDVALHQKTMTKVQNNVEEIMEKDYEYVLANMGIPQVATYHMTIEDCIENIENLQNGIIKADNIRMVYTKSISEDENNKSAIIVQIEDDKVASVNNKQIDINKSSDELNTKNSDIVISYYKNHNKVYLTDEILNKAENYIGKDKASINEILGVDIPDVDIYSKNTDCNVQIYLTDEVDGNSEYIIVCIKDNVINNIQIEKGYHLIDVVKNKI